MYWERVMELSHKEEKLALIKDQPNRFKVYRGFKIKSLPKAKNRRRVVIEPYENATSLGSQRKNAIDLGVPDDLLIAEGSNSKSRKTLRFQYDSLGPSTRFIAGFISFNREKLNDRVNVVRNFEAVEDSDFVVRNVILNGGNADGVWAVSEIDPTQKSDYSNYFAQKIGFRLNLSLRRTLELSSYGPHVFTLQSHIAGAGGRGTDNVHLIGDSRGHSHFLTSLGKVTGTGTHQLSLGQYWSSIGNGTTESLARAILDKRLDAGTRAWIKLGYLEFTTAGGKTYPPNSITE